MIEGMDVVGINFVGVLVGFEGLVVPAKLIEDEPHIEEPGGVVGIDNGGETDFAQRFRPFALLEKLLGLFDPTLCIAPVVHFRQTLEEEDFACRRTNLAIVSISLQAVNGHFSRFFGLAKSGSRLFGEW
jgi:hypothetical protein